jgi:streptomycin 6-kinase
MAIELANRSEATTWRKSLRSETALATHVEALNAFGTHRASAVVDVLQKEAAVLLERVTPGERLASVATETEAMAVIARLFAEGWPRVPEPASATPLRMFTESLTHAAVVDPEFERPAALLDELLTTSTDHVLLHGDLHYDNILSSDRTGYLLIDPRGALGDPAFDIGYVVSRPMPAARGGLSFAEAAGQRLAFLPKALGLDPQRVAAFAYVTAALSAAWAREDNDPAVDAFLHATRILEGRC